MKKRIASFFLAVACLLGAQQPVAYAAKEVTPMKILSDETRDGIRYVSATPISTVCSNRIDIQIEVKGHIVREAKFTGGCPGNTLGVCTLIKGMTVENVIKKLDGIPCGNRPTSCPDQLAQVLKSLKW